MHENEWLKMLDERDWVEEDEFEWYFWINLCYASFIKREIKRLNKHLDLEITISLSHITMM